MLIVLLASLIFWWRLNRGPNVLLITLDTTRADRLGCYGYRQGQTPWLDRLAREGILFENALANIPLTLPSHATIHTGLLPPEHGLRLNGMGSLPENIPTLAEEFTARGYRTGAFVGALVLDRRFGLDRSFSTYDDNFTWEPPIDERYLARRRNAGRVVDSALDWLLGRSSRPYFCWLHLYDPHHPCSEHRAEFGETFAGRGYDAELAYTDQQLQRLTETLRAQGLLDDTLIIVTGDHGESLGEHDELNHGLQLYQSTQRIPLIIHCPRRFPVARSVPHRVGLNDIFPTLADCLDWQVTPATRVAGRSLRPALQGQPLTDVPYYCETWEPFFSLHCSPAFAVVSGHWKYIQSPQPELYDLSRDPQETRNLLAEQPARAAELRAVLHELESCFVPRDSAETHADARLIASLKSMGYSGGATKLPLLEAARQLPDHKSLMPATLRMQQALEAHQPPPRLLPTLQKIVANHPQFHRARIVLAALLLEQSEPLRADPAARLAALHQAEQLCRDVIQAERDWPVAERNPDAPGFLASILVALEQFDAAGKMYELAAQSKVLNPSLFVDWSRLLLAQKRPEEAQAKLRLAIDLDPGLFSAQLRLGELLLEQATAENNSALLSPELRERMKSEALQHFESATKFNPRFLPAHFRAAEILMSRAQFAAAAEHYAQIAAVETKNADVRYLWAIALANQQHYTRASEVLREALRLNPQHAQSRDLLRLCESQ